MTCFDLNQHLTGLIPFFPNRCIPGKYAASANDSKCASCEQGRYQPGVGSSNCTNITVGFKGIGGTTNVSHPGHMAEVPCSAGKYFSAFTCLACRTDTFTSSAGEMSCEDCDPGTYTDLENGSTVCRVCDAGKEMTGELGSRECLGCDPGKISVFGENCTDCGRGSYANSGKTACVLCEKGTWSSALGANDITTCRNCSLGRYSSATGSSEESTIYGIDHVIHDA